MKANIRDRVVSLALLAGSVIVLVAANGFSAGPNQDPLNTMSSEIAANTIADTIPQKNLEREKRELLEEIEEIDWEEMKAEIESARLDALEEIEEIDWEEMKIDFEQMKIDIENSINEVDWEEIKNELLKPMIFLDSLHIELNH